MVTTRDRGLSPFFNDPFFRNFFGQDFFGVPRKKREKSLGSGVIVSADGLVLTSSHVVEGATEIIVTMADKRELKAEIVGSDPKSDVAVVRLQGDNIGKLRPIPLGDSTALRLGEVVLAIGNPFGLSHTVTMGILISDVNPGSSAFAAGLKRGEVIRGFNGESIANASRFEEKVAAFGAGSNIELEVLDQGGTDRKVVLSLEEMPAPADGAIDLAVTEGQLEGMSLAPVTGATRQKYFLPEQLDFGAVVTAVRQGSLAAQAGLQPGDVLLELNKKELADPADFLQRYRTIGRQDLLLLLYRNGATIYLVRRR